MKKTPPHSEEAEKALIGCVLMNPKTFDEVGHITKDHFYIELHRKMWSCIYLLATANEVVDTVTVSEVSKSRGWGEIVSIYSITMILADACIPIRLSSYARIVSNAYTLRQARYVGDSLVEQSLAAEKPSESVISDTITKLEMLALGKTDAGVTELKDELMNWLNGTLAIADSDGYVESPTGLSDLDELMGGWQRSDLVICAARPAMGKTGFALSTILHALRLGKRVFMFSLEMSKSQLITRLTAMEADVDLSDLLRGRMTEVEIRRVSEAVARMADYDLLIDDTPNMHVNLICSSVRRAHAKKPVDLMVGDYFQLMDGRDGDRGNRDTELGHVSRSLKGLAKQINAPFLLLAQLSREVEKRPSKRPQLADLRETGNAEQDADIVMFLMRPEYYGLTLDDGNSSEGIAQVIVAKHRNGPTGEFNCHFNKTRAQFGDMAQMFSGGQF